jgi:hypothetical protein
VFFLSAKVERVPKSRKQVEAVIEEQLKTGIIIKAGHCLNPSTGEASYLISVPSF